MIEIYYLKGSFLCIALKTFCWNISFILKTLYHCTESSTDIYL